jgi:hypothetical protein
MAQIVEHKALSSNTSPTKKRERLGKYVVYEEAADMTPHTV